MGRMTSHIWNGKYKNVWNHQLAIVSFVAGTWNHHCFPIYKGQPSTIGFSWSCKPRVYQQNNGGFMIKNGNLTNNKCVFYQHSNGWLMTQFGFGSEAIQSTCCSPQISSDWFMNVHSFAHISSNSSMLSTNSHFLANLNIMIHNGLIGIFSAIPNRSIGYPQVPVVFQCCFKLQLAAHQVNMDTHSEGLHHGIQLLWASNKKESKRIEKSSTWRKLAALWKKSDHLAKAPWKHGGFFLTTLVRPRNENVLCRLLAWVSWLGM